MANLNSSVLSSFVSSINVMSIENVEIKKNLWKAKIALGLSIEQPEKAAHWNKEFNAYLSQAKKAIRLSLPIDYTPKKNVTDDWDNAPAFGQQAPKQETDLEDTYLSSKVVSFRGKPDQGKSKAKWARSGRAARVLSNR
jgi:hypothetical protein